jgi:hypothetical protein
MRHHPDTPKIQAHQPENTVNDLHLAKEANDDALNLLRAIDGSPAVDIEAIRKRVTLRHYQMVARLAAVAKTAEKQ